ncbi:glycoside hydrolase family 27 protein [Clostridium sp. SM-530-WT-3G]|uniref:glycoside hydrolase family 27 protein n=1 Tax=Clostridium sp. SM-530-WT-3G TaxID=2725303 RepID=UPI00145F4576|nr:glycoside hydrolase family 27 protein [Clostridium sp. SM-530-WT-3G]NME83720.1 glycoside hydrolase family 27 protein [Clostridium sp. SM-530-WT-3G]
MNKNEFAITPPMGWNSWDVYGASVTEDEVRKNAEYMAENLKEYGWEYVVVDIQWYEPKGESCYYNAFTELNMDEYSRLIPAENRFPSSKGGKGFKPLADYIHELGLKFGIHIMRGIPRQAVHNNTKILGTDVTAREIASTDSICRWNTDMYGVDSRKKGAAEYYESLIKLYSEWGVDFIKMDDSSCAEIGDVPYFAGEIELIRKAIDESGREIVLSLSPGPTSLESAQHVMKNANMWRMTGDYWDRWSDLYNEFEKCRKWSIYSGPGHWPDADMLPIGRLGIRTDKNDNYGIGRMTRFTKDEQIMMISLWCMFRSPLMIGSELTQIDEWTLSLITNSEVLKILNDSQNGYEVYRKDDKVVWFAEDRNGSVYIGLFNLREVKENIGVDLKELGMDAVYIGRDLWSHEDIGNIKDKLEFQINPHSCRLIKLYK